MTARMAAAVDDLSGGRLVLGVGAGWQEREHDHYGWQLLPPEERFQRFAEGLEIIHRLLRSDKPLDFNGKFYRLKEAIVLPKPRRPGRPPILVGGNGPRHTLSLAARFADEWNAVYLQRDRFTRLTAKLDELLEEVGRLPQSVRRSMMTGCVFGRDEAEVRRKVDSRTGGKADPDDLRQRGLIVGTASQIVDQLGSLSDAGLQRIMLQWVDLDDMDGLQALAAGVLPYFYTSRTGV
jgi:alkanesulfonate monooxygenase SsuD/methylene tetrahydromethanopterin reductase-like flavin-dependent oxidoreductase (luciferase family)